MRTRNPMLLAAAALAVGSSLGLSTISAQAETVVRYGISMADIPLTTGQPDRGAGELRQSDHQRGCQQPRGGRLLRFFITHMQQFLLNSGD